MPSIINQTQLYTLLYQRLCIIKYIAALINLFTKTAGSNLRPFLKEQASEVHACQYSFQTSSPYITWKNENPFLFVTFHASPYGPIHVHNDGSSERWYAPTF